jgi:hypothetical protein
MTFVHRPVGLVELLILYARVQFYTPRASDYRLISKTGSLVGLHAVTSSIIYMYKAEQKQIMSGDNDSTQDFQFYLIFCYKLNMKEKKMYIMR